MAFSEAQLKNLEAKLDAKHVRTRRVEDTTLAYVEGWHVIAEANRIFGFENWDRQTQTQECQWSETQRGQTVCFYSAKVRITVRSGDSTTVREGIGTGLGRSPQAELAHEMAVKAAETDATKRAMATFGNPFGLALYDRDQTNVTKPREKMAPRPPVPPPPSPGPLILVRADEGTLELADVAAFVAATRRELQQLDTLDAVYAFWTRNLPSFAEVAKRDESQAPRLAEALKARLREIGQDSAYAATPARSRLLIPKETRIRDRDHLAFVARQPCLICGRRPAQAHHLRFAQPRAMSLKVSDEYTVPLCNGHHDALHRTGDERAWWARHGIIEPLKFAARLWVASRNGDRDSVEALAEARPEPPAAAPPHTGTGGLNGAPAVEQGAE
jgi:DNA recombination protein Rad52